jgi:hypothetical protein
MRHRLERLIEAPRLVFADRIVRNARIVALAAWPAQSLISIASPLAAQSSSSQVDLLVDGGMAVTMDLPATPCRGGCGDATRAPNGELPSVTSPLSKMD